MSGAWASLATRPFERDKFKELILYIATKSARDVNFGDTKLNKLLFYSERLSLVRLGRSLTGQRFQKQQFGHTSRNLLGVRNEMMAAGDCQMIPIRVGSKLQERTVAGRPPRTSAFSKDELLIIDEVLEQNRHKTGSQMSREAKTDLCWKVAKDIGDEVHLAALVFQHRPLTREEADFARQARARLNGEEGSAKA